MRYWDVKRYKRLGLATMMMGIMIFVAILQPKRIGCRRDEFNRSQMMPDLTHMRLLNTQSLSDFHQLAIVNIPALLVGRFSLFFSPDSSMLAISGVGWIESDYSTTFLWKLKRSPLCLVEGPILSGSSTLTYQEFSPDSQIVIMNECNGRAGQGCYTLWDTQTDSYIKSYYDAHFVQHNLTIRFEYQRAVDSPIVVGGQTWPMVDVDSLGLDLLISGKTLKLIDLKTGKLLRTIQASGEIKDAKMSPGGTLLAIAVGIPRPDYEGLPWSPSVELWGVTGTVADGS